MKNLGKYENPSVKKAWKVTTILVCIFVFVPCLALGTLGILHLCGVTPMQDSSTHVYTVRYYDVEESGAEVEFLNERVIRGGKLRYTYKPTREGYKFRGWDTNNNNFPNIVPTRIFKDINAKALWVPIKDLSIGGDK